MGWESKRILLACGCESSLPWQDDIVGVEDTCSRHGTTEVVKAGRIYEASNRTSYSFGTVAPEAAEVPAEGAA